MRYSKFLLPTLKEWPSDAESIAMKYMLKSGMIKKVSSGLFFYMPYFNMILRKVNYTIRRGMEKVDCNEMKFPILVSKEVLEKSNRWTAFGKEMFSLSDRNGDEFAISPTNEEYATIVADTYVKSYNDLPFSIYQIQQKHRDEIRPRNGVNRAREFTMKDAYSFHANKEDLDSYYKKMHDVYLEIYNNLGLKVVPVVADGGVMGGSYCHEFMAVSNEGEADIAFCDECGYGANLETVPCKDIYNIDTKYKGIYKKVYTPKTSTISDLMEFLGMDAKRFVKSMVYKAGDQIVMAMVRGDREVNETKLAKIMGCGVELASEKDIKKIGSVLGFVGPIGNLKNVRILGDYEIKGMEKFVVGANEEDAHLIDVGAADFKCEWVDLRFADSEDVCPICGGDMHVSQGNELGHIFALGDRYTKAFDATFVDKDGKNKIMEMGCYGIGLERIVSSIIDQHHDDKGIILPMNVAPFKVDIVIVDMKKKEQVKFAEKLYNDLENAGIPVLLDDRDERAGVKFNDSELIGVPLRVVVGRGIVDGKVELTIRETGEKFEIDKKEIKKTLAKLINK